MSQDPVARSDLLDAKLDGSAVVTNLVELAKQHTRIIRYLRICVAVIIVLLIGLGWAVWKAQSAASAAKDASSQVRVTCIASNEARASQRQLWTFVLTSFPPPPNETSQERQRRVEQTTRFKKYVKNKFAPLDCSSTALKRRGEQAFPQPTPAPTPTGIPSRPSMAGQSTSGATTAVQPSHHSRTHPPHSSSPTPSTHPSATPSATNSPTPKPTRSPLCVPVVHKCFVSDNISLMDLIVLWVWRLGWHG
jgi:hypothetical protein